MLTQELLNGVLNDVRNAARQLRQSAGNGPQNANAAGAGDTLTPIADTLDAAADRLAGGMAGDANFTAAASGASSSSAGGAGSTSAPATPATPANPPDQSGTTAAAADVGAAGQQPAAGARPFDVADLRRGSDGGTAAAGNAPASSSAAATPASSSAAATPAASGASASSTAPAAAPNPSDQSGTIAAAADVGTGADVSGQLGDIRAHLQQIDGRISALERQNAGGAGGTGAAAPLEGAAAAAAGIGRRA